MSSATGPSAKRGNRQGRPRETPAGTAWSVGLMSSNWQQPSLSYSDGCIRQAAF